MDKLLFPFVGVCRKIEISINSWTNDPKRAWEATAWGKYGWFSTKTVELKRVYGDSPQLALNKLMLKSIPKEEGKDAYKESS